ncbi:MAG TPA: hypothetical protein VFY93_12035 [Planctomycetota bacterium]|nr:hypothetical protein [Planctomycetota bacterium]
MRLLLLLILDGWPVSAGQWAVDRLHTYDLLSCDVDARPTGRGLEIDCTLRLVVGSPGPLRFLLSGAVVDLVVTQGDKQVPSKLGAFGLEGLLDFAGIPRERIPMILEVEPDPPPAAGAEVTLRLRYRWHPPPGGWYRAGPGDVETHLSGFWLPTMADEIFASRVRVHTDVAAFAPGTATRTDDGWLFESDAEQIVPLFVADLARVNGNGCEVWLPAAEAFRGGEAITRDLAAVLRAFEARFGPPGPAPFRLVVAPEANVPSYCGGSFAVVKARPAESLEPAERERWIAHLAHECAHRWFGYRLKTPVIGRGGTWLREGLAEWGGIEVAGEILGAEARERLWRDRFARYVSGADLRTEDRVLFANETTLLDATYVDDPRIPYCRGALVLRLLANGDAFAGGLRRMIEGGPGGIVDAKDVLSRTGGAEIAAYYAGTTRLPDLRLEEVRFEARAVRARVLCDDPLWPGGRVPVRVETAAGAETADVLLGRGGGELSWKGASSPVRVEVDPERLYLDPIPSNNVAER